MSFWKGSTFQKRFTFRQNDEDSTPVDLTGFNAELIIKDSTGPVLTLASGSGLVLGGTAGTIDVNITSTQTAATVWRTATYTLSITSPTSVKDFLLFGNFTVKG